MVKEYFEERATTFDSLYINESRLSYWLNSTFRSAIYERFQIALNASGRITDKTVLDIGCGSGRYLVEYAKRGARRVVGVDLSPKMLDLARNLIIQEGVEDRCELVQGDFLQLDIIHQFDIVLGMGLFDYIAEGQDFLKKMASVAGGSVIASFPGKSTLRMHFRRLRYRLRNCPVYFYSESEIQELSREAGLRDYKVISMPSGAGFVLLAQQI